MKPEEKYREWMKTNKVTIDKNGAEYAYMHGYYEGQKSMIEFLNHVDAHDHQRKIGKFVNVAHWAAYLGDKIK